MKRFVFAFLLSLGIAAGGIWLKTTIPQTRAIEISINFRSLSRLLYEAKKLDLNGKSSVESVPLDLGIEGVFYRGKIRPLPLAKGPLSALLIEIDERETTVPHYLILIKKGTMTLPENSVVLTEGELSLNGRPLEIYQLLVHPFLSALEKGLGPLGHWVNGSLELSPLSKRFEVLRERRVPDEAPSSTTNAWFAWDPEHNQWRPWGIWPEGWPL